MEIKILNPTVRRKLEKIKNPKFDKFMRKSM